MPQSQQPYEALRTLLAGSRQPYHSGDYAPPDDGLQDFAPSEQELRGMQDQATEVSPHGDYTFIPSRDSQKESAMQQLKRTLRMNEIAAQQKALPAHVTGEYNLRREGLRGQATVEAAKANAAARASQQQGQQQFQAGQNDLNRTAATERNTYNQNAMDTRAKGTQAALSGRVGATHANQIDTLTQTGKIKPAGGGLWAGLKNLIGMGDSAPAAQQTSSGNPSIDQMVADHPQASFDDLVSQYGAGASADELALLQSHMAQLGRQ